MTLLSVSAAALAMMCASANAQLTPDGPALAAGLGVGTTLEELAGGEAASTYDASTGTLTLTGDGFYTHDADVSGTAFGAFFATQTFTPTDSFPVEISPVVTADFKVANGGFLSSDTPRTGITYGFFLFETGNFDPGNTLEPGDLGDLLVLPYDFETFPSNGLLEGNGFAVIDETATGDSFVLASGISYTAVLRIAAESSLSDLPDSVTSTTFIEAGGLSGFDGLSVALNARFVPEPAMLGLAVFAPMLLGRRRR
ncbi:MAG: hypothetical protein AAGD32_16045 [Planctomycetota bacterium]